MEVNLMSKMSSFLFVNRRLVLVFVSVLVLSMMFAAVVPVFAVTSKKIPVIFTRAGVSFTLGTDFWTTEGETYHSRGSTTGYSSYSITGPGVDLVGGTSYATLDQNLNLKTSRGEQHFDSEIDFTAGSFVGGHNVKGTFGMYTGAFMGLLKSVDTSTMGVWHGTGAYHGWTLVMEYATGDPAVGGYVLIPNGK
jgi:hypothetical protein